MCTELDKLLAKEISSHLMDEIQGLVNNPDSSANYFKLLEAFINKPTFNLNTRLIKQKIINLLIEKRYFQASAITKQYADKIPLTFILYTSQIDEPSIHNVLYSPSFNRINGPRYVLHRLSQFKLLTDDEWSEFISWHKNKNTLYIFADIVTTSENYRRSISKHIRHVSYSENLSKNLKNIIQLMISSWKNTFLALLLTAGPATSAVIFLLLSGYLLPVLPTLSAAALIPAIIFFLFGALLFSITVINLAYSSVDTVLFSILIIKNIISRYSNASEISHLYFQIVGKLHDKLPNNDDTYQSENNNKSSIALFIAANIADSLSLLSIAIVSISAAIPSLALGLIFLYFAMPYSAVSLLSIAALLFLSAALLSPIAAIDIVTQISALSIDLFSCSRQAEKTASADSEIQKGVPRKIIDRCIRFFEPCLPSSIVYHDSNLTANYQ